MTNPKRRQPKWRHIPNGDNQISDRHPKRQKTKDGDTLKRRQPKRRLAKTAIDQNGDKSKRRHAKTATRQNGDISFKNMSPKFMLIVKTTPRFARASQPLALKLQNTVVRDPSLDNHADGLIKGRPSEKNV